MDDTELLGLLAPVLAADAGTASSAGFAVVRQSRRNRSIVYFVGLLGSDVPRWVVKVPSTARVQHDLTSPLAAETQFAVMERLHTDLGRGSVRTPRPVAYVPELDAVVTEFVDGSTVAAVVSEGLVRRSQVAPALEAAATTLRALHELSPVEDVEVDLAGVEREAIGAARTHLQVESLPIKESWFRPAGTSSRLVVGRRVVLHGDFVPENVLLTTDSSYCLDPDLTHRDWAEQDVARFVVMLCDAPLFVTAGVTPPVRALRRLAVTTFLTAYYGGQPASPLLRPLTLSLVAARWRARHEDVSL
ncbi:MAG: hypothetical protein QOK15_1125, partial [Nocardioidaceae bacterium]|nr:hypothetical protein [Nocardioidaceae bacterium]